jgi:hypothetical protein
VTVTEPAPTGRETVRDEIMELEDQAAAESVQPWDTWTTNLSTDLANWWSTTYGDTAAKADPAEVEAALRGPSGIMSRAVRSIPELAEVQDPISRASYSAAGTASQGVLPEVPRDDDQALRNMARQAASRDPRVVASRELLGEHHDGVTERLGRAMQKEHDNYDDLLADLRGVGLDMRNRTASAARYSVNASANAAVAATTEALGAELGTDLVLVWVPETDACARCLAYAGLEVPADGSGEFPPGLSYDPNSGTLPPGPGAAAALPALPDRPDRPTAVGPAARFTEGADTMPGESLRPIWEEGPDGKAVLKRWEAADVKVTGTELLNDEWTPERFQSEVHGILDGFGPTWRVPEVRLDDSAPWLGASYANDGVRVGGGFMRVHPEAVPNRAESLALWSGNEEKAEVHYQRSVEKFQHLIRHEASHHVDEMMTLRDPLGNGRDTRDDASLARDGDERLDNWRTNRARVQEEWAAVSEDEVTNGSKDWDYLRSWNRWQNYEVEDLLSPALEPRAKELIAEALSYGLEGKEIPNAHLVTEAMARTEPVAP